MENAEINKVISLMIAELSTDGCNYNVVRRESHYIIVKTSPKVKEWVAMFALTPVLMARMADDGELRRDILGKIQRAFMVGEGRQVARKGEGDRNLSAVISQDHAPGQACEMSKF